MKELGRPLKLNHVQTILWEIDSVRFSASGLSEPNDWCRWRNLECFLLHFRNLIEFFGKPVDGNDTLSVLKPEKLVQDSKSRDELKKLYRNDLWVKYEVRNRVETNDKISRYLQHCTEEMENPRIWIRPPVQIVAFPKPSLGTATIC